MKLTDENLKIIETCTADIIVIIGIEKGIKKRMEYIQSQIVSLVMMLEDKKLSKLSENVTRVEVIDETERAYINWKKENKVKLSFQDNGRTLKIFISKKEEDYTQDPISEV